MTDQDQADPKSPGELPPKKSDQAVARAWVDENYPYRGYTCNFSFRAGGEHGFIAGIAHERAEHQQEIRKLEEALKFYADTENWDTENMTPTIWDDGSVDLGKRARAALAAEKPKPGQTVCAHGNPDPMTCFICNVPEQKQGGEK